MHKLRGSRNVLVRQQDADCTAVDGLHDRRIVPPLRRNAHTRLGIILGVLFILVPHIALLAEDNEGIEDLIILKVVRRLETLCHKLSSLLRQVHCRLESLNPFEALARHRIPRIEIYKETVRIAIDSLRRVGRIGRSRSIEGLNHLLRRHNLLATIGRNRRRQVLKTNLECARAELTIERVRRQLVCQLFSIQQRLAERIRLLLGLLALCLSGGEQLPHNGGQSALREGAVRGGRRLRITADAAAYHDFARHLLRIVLRVRSPDVKVNIGEEDTRSSVLLICHGAETDSQKVPVRVKVLHPDERVVADILGLNRARIQRGEIRNAHGALKVESGLGVEHNRALIALLLHSAWLVVSIWHHLDDLARL